MSRTRRAHLPGTLLSLALGIVACGPKAADSASDPSSTSDTGDTTAADASTASDPTTPNTSATSSSGDVDPTTTGPVTTQPTITDPVTTDPSGADPDQTPPQGHDAIEAWLAEGHYKSWHCEPAPHDPLPISPHGKQLICANDLLSGHATLDEYPVGSASVKELRDASGSMVLGYAVSLHIAAGTTGDTWYWYERVPQDSPAPHDDQGIVADGPGDSGPAMAICVGCHAATGIDADHPGHDYVYRQVQ